MGAESKLSAEAAARFVLGLSQGCSKEDVKRAFRRLALVFHPDKNKGQNEEEATKRFQAIATAKDLLLKTSSAAGHLQTNSAHGRRPTTPTPAKKPVYVAIWMCGACQMRHLGSSPGSGRNSDVACARASSSTLCFCGHRFGAHELVEGAGALKFRCRQQGCACGNFSYVPPGALCTCGHGPGSHDAKPFHSCQVSGCLCQTFHHAGVCSCRHSWACHRTEIQKLGPSPYAGNPGNPAAAKTTFCPWRRPCDERSECSDDCGATTRGNASSRPEAKAEPARSTSTVPPARSSAPSPTPASPAAPAAPAPRGRGVSAPSTPTGRSRSSSATGDAFFMPKFENLGQNAGPSGDSRNYVQSGQRLDVRGKPIGRCPSVPTPARGATPTPASPASPASPSAAPRAASRSTSQTPRASSPAEADTATSADKAVRARPRPSSAPPVRTDQAAMRPEPTGPTEPTGPPCATRPPRPRPSSAGAKGSSSGRGFGCTFEAPIGGVLFALELMLPQSYDVVAYWGCFCASVVGAITYLLLKSNPFGHVRRFLPLVSSNVLPGEGDSTEFPVLELLTFILLGIFCGLAGGLFVRSHAVTVRILRRWSNSTRIPRLKSAQEPLLRRRLLRLPSFHGAGGRDLLLVALLALTNTLLASSLPLLGGLPQPLLVSKIFDKNLLEDNTWILPKFGLLGTLLLCFMAKWTMSLWSLSAEIPGGVLAPCIVLGALLGRIYAVPLPEWFLDLLLSDSGVADSGVTDSGVTEAKGALLARFAIIGASAFTAGVCRTFAMAITVFELLTLPNSVLPLCASALVAIFAANRVALPFFDSTLAAEDLGGIPALGFSAEALWPVMKVMEPIQLETDALPQVLTLRHLLKLVTERDGEVFPIIRPLDWTATKHQALLVGCMTRRQALRLLKACDPHGETPRREIDLMNVEFQAPSDETIPPYVDGNPLRISPEHTVKDAYLLMKMSEQGVIYVTNRGVLIGSITLGTLLCREL